MKEELLEQYTMLSNGLLVDSAGIARPPWACANDLLRDYYDTEWGRPVHGEQAYYERLCLEGFQAGLSWELILRRRESLREAFANFVPDVVADFTASDIERIVTTKGMIRNERKIRAVVTNAQACLALRDDPDYPGGLEELINEFAPIYSAAESTAGDSADGATRSATKVTYAHLAEVPTQSAESKALAKKLKSKGFSFVGPTSMFALFEAIGLHNYEVGPGQPVTQPDDHENG